MTTLRIETKPISSLTPADYNPRQISDEALSGLEASIKRFGLVQPIVWNERTGHVVGGHQRLKVLQKNSTAETQVIVVDLPESEEKALNVTMNNPHIEGEFTGELPDILDDLRIDLDDVFDELRLDELLDSDPLDSGFYDGEPAEKGPSMADKFIIPPFSVLDARQGAWQERKRKWLSLGIRSEIGRGGALKTQIKQISSGVNEKR